jgi:hypothetical protein
VRVAGVSPEGMAVGSPARAPAGCLPPTSNIGGNPGQQPRRLPPCLEERRPWPDRGKKGTGIKGKGLRVSLRKGWRWEARLALRPAACRPLRTLAGTPASSLSGFRHAWRRGARGPTEGGEEKAAAEGKEQASKVKGCGCLSGRDGGGKPGSRSGRLLAAHFEHWREPRPAASAASAMPGGEAPVARPWGERRRQLLENELTNRPVSASLHGCPEQGETNEYP